MNVLGGNIARCRKEKGLSQEKLAEYMGTSRQAVTKWESGMSKPSTENLLKLSELFDVKVENLLATETDYVQKEAADISMGKGPAIWCILSILCVMMYAFYGIFNQRLSVGTFICLIVIAFPVQLFLNLYLTNALGNEDFSNIAGFDSCINYNLKEVKKLLVNMNQHIGVVSMFYVFLISIGSYSNVTSIDIVGLLVVLYVIEMVGTILLLNYRAIEKIYCDEKDVQIAKHSLPITVSYLVLLLVGSVIFISVFHIKEIRNNTAPALGLSVILLMGVIFATIGFFRENNRLKKWDFSKEEYRISNFDKGCSFIAVICFLIMPFV